MSPFGYTSSDRARVCRSAPHMGGSEPKSSASTPNTSNPIQVRGSKRDEALPTRPVRAVHHLPRRHVGSAHALANEHLYQGTSARAFGYLGRTHPDCTAEAVSHLFMTTSPPASYPSPRLGDSSPAFSACPALRARTRVAVADPPPKSTKIVAFAIAVATDHESQAFTARTPGSGTQRGEVRDRELVERTASSG